MLFLAISVLGAQELCSMLEAKKPDPATRLIYFILSLLPFGALYLGQSSWNGLYPCLLLISGFIMCVLMANLWSTALPYQKFRFLFTTLYWALPLGLAAYLLLSHAQDYRLIVMSVILLIWTSDTMAFFTGKSIGKNKLFPSVSPGKTIEGSVGAGVFSILLGLGFAYGFEESYQKWIVIAIVVWVLGTLGDLVESRLKRVQGVKDSGSILPGHGGFLDRFDSLIMIIPFLLLLDYFLGA